MLKVAHHGAATSDIDWIEGTGANLAVISVGSNDFRHPSRVVAALEASGARVVRTDRDGDMIVRPPWRDDLRHSTIVVADHDQARSRFSSATAISSSMGQRPRHGGGKRLARVAQPSHGRRHPAEAGRLAESHAAAGADLIDLGAQSSHYEEATLTPKRRSRLGTGIEGGPRRRVAGLGRHLEAGGGEACHRRRSGLVNDTGGLRDPAMIELLAETGVAGWRCGSTGPTRIV